MKRPLLLGLCLLTAAISTRAQSGGLLVISQVYGGGGNSGAVFRNDYIELYNRGSAPVDVSGWSVQYAAASGSSWAVTPLSGVIPPGRYYLVQEAAGTGGTTNLPTPDAIGTIAMAAGAGKVALAPSPTAFTVACPAASAVVDFVGYGATANCFEGSGPTPAPSNTTAVLRNGGGTIDTNNNSTDFTAGAPDPRNSETVVGALAGTGAATPSAVVTGGSSLLTVVVTPATNPASTGMTVQANLSAIGGSATQAFFDDGSNGDMTAGDNVFSWLQSAIAGTPGPIMLPVDIADAQGRQATTAIQLTILAPSANVVISQVYGGGGNSGAEYRNDFIELRNHEAFDVSVAGWTVQYTSANGTSWSATPLSGTIPAGGFYLVQEAAGAGGTLSLPTPDAIGNIAMGATEGKIALVSGSALLAGACPLASAIDFVGYGGANCFEGSSAAPSLSNTTAALRLNDGLIDTNDNGADFVRGAPTPRTTVGLPPRGIGLATPASLAGGDATVVSVAVTAGAFPPSPIAAVTADLTAFGGSSTHPLLDDGLNGDLVAGDLVFSTATIVTGAPGFLSIPATIRDARDRTGTTAIRLAIETPTLPIAVIQGTESTSPHAGSFVTTTGIVTARRSNGFFLQTPDGETDSDPRSSEGIFVFTGSNPLGPQIGDELRVSGVIVEFVPADPVPPPPLTELGGGPLWAVVASGRERPEPITLVAADTTPGGGREQLERFEGMRVRADLLVVSPTDGVVLEEEARSVTNGNFFAVIEGVARPMREPGLDPSEPTPGGLPCCVPTFDGNPERLRVDSNGQLSALAMDVAAGQRITGMIGVVDYSFGTYTILPDPGAGTILGPLAAVPVPEPAAGEFTVAAHNLERFFDEIDAPAVDDTVVNADAVERRLRKASLSIRQVLRMPDVLAVIEAENLSILERLAARINGDEVAAGRADPQYVAYLEEGNDVGGIDSGLLVKSSRVTVVSVEQVDRLATFELPGGGTAILNDRPPLVLRALVNGPIGEPFPITVVANHLRSLSGITGSDGERIRAKRRAQAEFLASWIQARQATERIISVGDYNAFQFNDGLVDVIGTIKGQPTPADQVALASADLVNPDLTNLGDSVNPGNRYSFVFDGNAQTLDHVLVNARALTRFTRLAYARSNADFPESLRGDDARPERLSDHDAVVAYFSFPGAPVVTLNGSTPMNVEAFTSFEDPGATARDDEGPLTVVVSGAVDVNTPGDYTLTYTASNGFLTTTVTRLVRVRDTIAPAIDGYAVSPRILWPPDRRLVDVNVGYAVSDASGVATCSVSVASNRDGLIKPDQPDWIIVDPHHVRLRAEWAGLISTRVYTLSTSCSDPSGNTTIRSDQVFVPGVFALPFVLPSLL